MIKNAGIMNRFPNRPAKNMEVGPSALPIIDKFIKICSFQISVYMLDYKVYA